MRLSLRLALVATGLIGPLAAQTPDPPEALVDPRVFSVVSHAWPSNKQGVIRVISRAHGFEHVSTEVVAQWLEMLDDSEGNWGIAASKVLVAPGLRVFGAPRLSVQGDAIRAEFEGVHTYQPDDSIRSCFLLHPNQRVVDFECGERPDPR